MPDSARPNTKSVPIAWLILAGLPVVLLAINRSWILTPAGTSDGWAYYGYFTNLPAFLRAFPAAYNGSRLSWIVPGAVMHQVLPPMAANYALHLGVYYLAMASLYFTLRRVVGDRAALLMSIVTGCYSYFLRAVGWHYVDGAGVAYYSLALACVTAAPAARRRWLALLGAGAAYAGAIHSNMAWALMGPAFAYYHLSTPRGPATTPVWRDAGYVLIGLASLTVLLGAVAVANGGRFLFFAPTLAHGAGLAQQPKAYTHDWAAWLSAAYFLAVPSLVLLSALYVRVVRGRPANPLDRLAVNHLALMCATLVAADLSGRTLLQNANYWAFLIPGMALAAGALVRDWLDRLSSTHFAIIVTVALAAFVLPLSPAIGLRLAHTRSTAIASCVALAVTALWRRRSGNIVATSGLLVCVGLLNVTTVDGSWEFKNLPRREDEYRAIVAASHALRQLDPGADAWFWYDEDRGLGTVPQAIASTRLWGYRLIGTRFPSLWNPLTGQDGVVAPGQMVVLLTNQDDAATAGRVLHERGLTTTVVNTTHITEGDVQLMLQFLRTDVDRSGLADAPLAVSIDIFDRGSQRLNGARVTVNAGQDSIAIATTRGTYDEQVRSRPIPLVAERRYLAEFEVTIPSGGAALHVVSTTTKTVLASKYWCAPLVQATRQGLLFETTPDDVAVEVLLTNCGFPTPVESNFSIRQLRIWPYRDGQQRERR